MAAKRFVAGLIRVLCAIMSIAPQKDVIAFLSRQSAQPFDFQLLETELAQRFPSYRFEWACVKRGGQLGIGLFLRQLYLVSTARVCFVDGYVPAVSIPKTHRSVCIQVWHASGAIKKFGYQCLDTPAGRTSADAEAFRMHRGYDYIIAGMPGAVGTFAQAFDANPSTILPLGLPSLDYLLGAQYADARAQDSAEIEKQLGLGDTTCVVLYAPTFRRGVADAAWLEKNVRALAAAVANQDVTIVVAGHPLDADLLRELSKTQGTNVVVHKGRTGAALPLANLVISDYSSVALDAAVAGKPVLFYVPDIKTYRVSPGLNINPLTSFPQEAFTDAHDLVQAAQEILVRKTVPEHAFASFMDEYAGALNTDSTGAIVEMVSGIINS